MLDTVSSNPEQYHMLLAKGAIERDIERLVRIGVLEKVKYSD